MDRREFLKGSGILVASLAASGAGAESLFSNKSIEVKADNGDVTLPRNPNILLVLSDDMSYHDIGCYGALVNQTPEASPAIDITPTIDQFAAEGMRFTRCFTATAMCAPMRSMTYTGIHPVRNGAYPNHSSVKSNVKSLGHHFKALGYRVALSGKRHIKQTGADKPFNFEFLGSGSADPNVSLMESFMTRDSDQPFFLIATSHYPHGPSTVLYDQFNNNKDRFPLYPYMIDTPKLREHLAGYYSEVNEFDNQFKRYLNLLDKHNLKENTVVIFLSEQGSSLPHAKWTLYDIGLHIGCIIRWPAVVKPGTTNDAMVESIDLVPTLLQAAGKTDVDSLGMDGKSFLQVLLGQTDHHKDYVFGVHTTRGIIDAKDAGYPIRSIRSGRYHYIWNLKPNETFQNVITTGGENSVWYSWKQKAGYPSDPPKDTLEYKIVSIYLNRPEEEFYDIIVDPYELNNLADDPANRAIMDSMKAKLQDWMNQQDDEGIATEMAANN